MNMTNPRRRNTSLALTIAATLLVTAGLLTAGLGPSGHNRRGPIPARSASPWPGAARHRTAAEPTKRAPVNTTASTVSEIQSTESRLIIPALRVDAPLSPTGAVGHPGAASLTIPDNIHHVGWWDGTVIDGNKTVLEQAPQPGQPGVAIIAGHIDSAAAGPGALYKLKDLKVGDSIQVDDLEGRTSAWTVTSQPETTPKSALPTSLFATTGPDRLALISCGGPFDTTTGHYTDNIIVWAAPAQVN